MTPGNSPEPNTRFVRWQGYAMAQLTFTINLFLATALAVVGYDLNVVSTLPSSVTDCTPWCLLVSSGLLSVSLIAGIGAVISRLFDFRLTARKIRSGNLGAAEDELGLVTHKTKALGRSTWRLFWIQLAFLALGLGGSLFALLRYYFATKT